jgi:hypothetical protein
MVKATLSAAQEVTLAEAITKYCSTDEVGEYLGSCGDQRTFEVALLEVNLAAVQEWNKNPANWRQYV